MFTYEQIQSFNALELSVYNYVIQNIEHVTTMKIRELATLAHVSTTTILRFCTKVGCSGYSEFKVKLKLYSNQNKSQPMNEDTLFMKEFYSKVQAPEFNEQLDHCAKIIADSHYVLFYGIGSSGILGQYGARFFSNIGVYSSNITDPFYPLPIDATEKSVFIVLSVSGETEMVLHQVNSYKAQQFKVISITNTVESTLAKMSDGSIGYYMPIEILGEHYNVTTQVPAVYIIEALGRRVQKIKLHQRE